MNGMNSVLLGSEVHQGLPSFPSFPGRSAWPGASSWRLFKILSTLLSYNRLGAKSEARNGGRIPESELKLLLSSWAEEVLPLLRLEVQLIGSVTPSQTPTIFVGNHMSYLDIPVLMSQVPVVFLGKEEISRWPLFGAAGRRAGMVYVQRESDGSRRQAVRAIAECLETRGLSMGLFPSGTTTLLEQRPWRTGAFRMAKEGRFQVQPFRLTYHPLHRVAFVGKDRLLPHLYRLLQAGPSKAKIEFGAPRFVDDPECTARDLRAWSRKTHHS